MGCGASKEEQKQDTNGNAKESTRKGSTQSDTPTSRRMTVQDTRAVGAGRSPAQAYLTKTMDPWDITSESENQEPEKKKEEDRVDFIFGDFTVDTQDAVRLRQERLARVRGGKARLKRKTSGEWFMINDFRVTTDKIDEVEGVVDKQHETVKKLVKKRLKRVDMRCLPGHPGRIRGIAVVPGEEDYVSCSADDVTVTVSSIRDGREASQFVGHTEPITSVACSLDGKKLATTSRDSTAMTWAVFNNRQLHELEHPHMPICCVFSRDGKLLVTGSPDKICRVYDAGKGTELRDFDEHEGVVVCLAASMDGNCIASAGSDRTIRMWNIFDCTTVRTFSGHEGVVISVNFCTDGSRFLSNDDKRCIIWRIHDATMLNQIKVTDLCRPPTPVHKHVAVTPLAADWDTTVPDGGNTVKTAIAGANSSVVGQRLVFTVSNFAPGAFGPHYIIVGATNKCVYVIDLEDGQEETVIHTKSPVFAMGVGDVKTAVMGDFFGNVYRLSFE